MFTDLNAEKLVTGTAIENQPSCNLLNRLGLKRISEKVGSFRETPDGKPIEFIGVIYELTLDEWKLQNEV